MNQISALIRRRIAHRPNLVAALSNSGWLLADRILRIGVGLFVGVWVARYLGPEQFGAMNYAMAIVALFGAIAGLGLNGIVVRDLVRKPEGASLTLGSAFVLQLIGGFLAFVLAVAAISIMRPADDLTRTMVAILGFALVFKAAEVVKYWFESQVKSKYTVWAENGVFLALAAIRVVLILNQAPLLAFVWAALAETALAGVFLLLIYSRKAGALSRWSASLSRAKVLLMESWPLILGSVASMINMRMDQVMLGSMTNDVVVGNYAAAVRISEVWLMIPGILGASIYPSIIAAKYADENLYRSRILKITGYMALVVLPSAILISVVANLITNFFFGASYDTAGKYLAILIWSGTPYLIFFLSNQMYHIEKLIRLSFYVAVFSLILNLSLNFTLIPNYGGTGAAVATLISSVGATFLSLVMLNLRTGIFFGKLSKRDNLDLEIKKSKNAYSGDLE